MSRVAVLASASLLVGCGSAVFYQDASVCSDAPAAATASVVVVDDDSAPERASETIVADAWNDSLRDLIQLPPQRATTDNETCAADLAEVHAQVSAAIDLAIAHRDWRRQRCLSQKAQAVGTLYHAASGYPFRDQDGRPLELTSYCFAAQIAREARACVSI